MLQIDRQTKTPYYIQLYRQLLAGILDGTYPPGQRLSGSRTLATELGVGRNTVDNAYAQLAAEGYIVGKKGAGFQVLELPGLPETKPHIRPARAQTVAPETPDQYDLFYGSLAYKEFPVSLWKRYTAEVLGQEESCLINQYPGHKGDVALREQLVDYLYDTRGVRCHKDQILITSGLQGSLEILAKLLFPAGGALAMEDPGYDKALFIFQQHRVPTYFMDVDAAGASPAALPRDKSVRAIYITPSHQFPLGTVMPIARRRELSNWAHEQGAYIIEDDYDSDYSYDTYPVPSFQSTDSVGRVIYLGNFSKTLSPSMRMGYLVLPEALMECYETQLAKYNCMVPWITQRVTARLIENGHYRRMVRRLRTKFKKIHDHLVKEIGGMSGRVNIISQGSGLKFLLEVPGAPRAEWLISRALAQGVRVYPATRFWQRQEHCPANLVMIGFTSIETADISRCVALLDHAWFAAQDGAK